MTGHVRKRRWRENKDAEWHDAGWEYVIELGTVAGDRQRPTRGGFRTKKAAAEALRKELEAREAGTYAKPSRESYADYLVNRWLPWTLERPRRPVRESTHELYESMARLHILPALGALPLQDVRPVDVEALYMALAKPSKDGKRPALGSSSLHNVATVVHGSLEQAKRWELVSRNAAAGISPERPPAEDEPAHWTVDQVAAFLDHVDATLTVERTITERRKRRNGVEYTYTRTMAPDPMQRSLWYLLATTGMRRGEACACRWPDLDEESGVLEVKVSKTRRGRRVLALDPATLGVLAEWRRAQRRERLRYGPAWEDAEEHMFTHTVYFTRPVRHGVPVARRWVSAAMHKVLEGSGLPPMHVHGLRHSWATAAFEAGEHLRAVADHLGHADTAVTDRTYTHTVRRVQDLTALRVAGLIASKRGGGR